jgi:hypothetical protein
MSTRTRSKREDGLTSTSIPAESMTSIQTFWVELSVSPGPLTSTAKMRGKRSDKAMAKNQVKRSMLVRGRENEGRTNQTEPF